MYHTPISVGRFFDAGALYALRKPLKPIRKSKQLLAAAEIEADLGGQPAQRPCALPVQGGSGFPSGQVVQHLADMPPTLERDRSDPCCFFVKPIEPAEALPPRSEIPQRACSDQRR